VQGYGAIRGTGVELVITLGTGVGSALFLDGRLCPNLELGHHPWRKGKSYEDCLGRRGLDKYGKKRWNQLLQEAIVQTATTFNWDFLYMGGGNTKKIDFKPAKNVFIVPNEAGLLGGVYLWRDQSK
jgi:polyphosphate glucokinase